MEIIDSTVTLYRFHPVTNQDAEVLSDEELREVGKKVRNVDAAVIQFNEYRKRGAKFYWCVGEDGQTIERVERANIEFVVKSLGQNFKVIDNERSRI